MRFIIAVNCNFFSGRCASRQAEGSDT
jgi:hypothetical protein